MKIIKNKEKNREKHKKQLFFDFLLKKQQKTFQKHQIKYNKHTSDKLKMYHVKHFNESLYESIFINNKNPYLEDYKKNNLSIQNHNEISKKQFIQIRTEINTLDDILKIIDDYPIQTNIEYNIDLQSIHNIKQPLIELNNMIGMNQLKENIIDQILFYIQNLHNGTNDFMHTCIYGPPGTGKTEIAKIIGKIFSTLGILKNNSFQKVTRSDLIAGYLGQTAIKTRNIIKSALGGVLFIDEAYALGNPEKKDSFAKECIDTLCEGLSDHKENLMVIIAGYEQDLNKCFFNYNQGLNSRFTWRFKTDDYNSSELRQIFHKKVHDIGWKMKHNDIPSIEWFEEKMDYFTYYGRDMETLLSKVKIVHSRRVFCLENEKKRVLTKKDMDNGFQKFLENNEVKNRKQDNKHVYTNMYI